MRTCWACGARITSTPRTWRPSPGSSMSGRRSRTARWRRWWPTPRSTRCGCAARTSRASRTSRRSPIRSRAARESFAGSPARSHSPATSAKRSGSSSSRKRPGSLTAISRTRRLRPPWRRPAYAKRRQQQMGKDVDYRKAPSEDFASVTIEFETDERATLIGEASTSWSFVGAGLRLSAELLGPEYSMSWNTLDSGLKLFFSREVKGKTGEDLVEKQNAEMGLMPVVTSESAAYGYDAEDRHFVRVFLGRESPLLTFDDGLEVVKLLMTAYMSAEQGKTLDFPPAGIERFVPAVAKGTWKP